MLERVEREAFAEEFTDLNLQDINASDDQSQTDAVYNYDLPSIAKCFLDASTLQWESLELNNDFSPTLNEGLRNERSPYGECTDEEQCFTPDDFNRL